MSDQYRLVFSAEVVQGQHAAVVKKRLQAMLKLDDERMDVLFSGKSVVVKKATDEKTATRYHEAFNKAGARLRIEPLDAADDPLGVSDSVASSDAPQAPQDGSDDSANVAEPDQTAVTPGLSVLPPGSDVLSADERVVAEAAEVDTSHLSVQGSIFAVDEAPLVPPDTPNVDHLSLAEVGTPIGQPRQQSDEILLELDIDFDLAEVGAQLGEPSMPENTPEGIADVDFELAETGVQLGPSDQSTPPPAPDTSHIKLDE